MGRLHLLWIDPTQRSRGHILSPNAQIFQSTTHDHGWHKTAQGLLGASVGVVDEVWQGIEHGDRQAGGHLDLQLGAPCLALLGQVQGKLQ